MSTLRGKVAIITGASSGIGEATALALASHQVRVVLAARRRDRLEALARRITEAGGKALPVDCDVTRRDAVRGLIEQTLGAFGTLDILINNAGVMPLSPLAKCRLDDWDNTINVNLKGALYCLGSVLPVMLESGHGHIINISSVAGRRVFSTAAVYCASKFALHAISEALREELAERDDGNTIRVSIVAPGVVTTELPESITDAETRTAMKKYYASIRTPLKSQDVAEAIVWALQTPAHVAVNEILIRPTSQVR